MAVVYPSGLGYWRVPYPAVSIVDHKYTFTDGIHRQTATTTRAEMAQVLFDLLSFSRTGYPKRLIHQQAGDLYPVKLTKYNKGGHSVTMPSFIILCFTCLP